MMGRLGIEYIDLVYFHQPVGDYVGGWKEMEQVLALGKVRAIGISNFDARDDIFDSLLNAATVKPQIMQIECHPYAQRHHWQERLAQEGIQLECWFPLGGRDSKGAILLDPVITRIAKAHGKSAAQVISAGTCRRDSPSFQAVLTPHTSGRTLTCWISHSPMPKWPLSVPLTKRNATSTCP